MLFTQALGILASALDKRPFNARLNLDICALYGLLGAPHLALQHLERLEVKYIQMDSLASHFILPFLLGYHRTAGGRRLLVETILLFEEHDKDAGETIYTAYQRGTLTKVQTGCWPSTCKECIWTCRKQIVTC